MSYTHKIVWHETLSKGICKGIEVTKYFPIIHPGSVYNQRFLAKLRKKSNIRFPRIIAIKGV